MSHIETSSTVMDRKTVANTLITTQRNLSFDANKVMFYSSAYHAELMDKIMTPPSCDSAYTESNDTSS